MNRLLPLLALLAFAACKRSTTDDGPCALEAIDYSSGPNRSTRFTYGPDGIRSAAHTDRIIQYSYSGGRIAVRTVLRTNGELIGTDSIRYNPDGTLGAVIQRYRNYPNPTYGLIREELRYSGGGRLAGITAYVPGDTLRTTFSWTGEDLTEIVCRFGNGSLYDSTNIVYSTEPNPFADMGPDVPLVDPQTPFLLTCYDALARYYSRHRALYSTRRFGNGVVHNNVFVHTVSPAGRTLEFGNSATGEVALYRYHNCNPL
ncbi:MAG: hypothetical protein EOO16_09110 [Chitinophagaceae bacterium]|nr:MAG: hypothetical protein EOO16_09110 [Chitinophagaceae bacterium]